MGIPGKLNFILIAVGMVVLVLAGGIYYGLGTRRIDQHLNNKVRVITDRLKVSLPTSIFEYDMATLRATVRAEFPDSDVEAILVYEVDDELLFGLVRRNGVPVEVDSFHGGERLIGQQATLLVADERFQEVLGRVAVFLSRSNEQSILVRNTVQGVLAICAALALMAMMLGYVVNRYLVSPIEAIRKAMVKTSEAVKKGEAMADWQGPELVRPLQESSAAFAELVEMEACFVEMVETIQNHQEMLSERESHLRRIFNATSEAIIIRDAETGVLRDANDAMLEMYGYARDELHGLTVADLVCENDAPTVAMIAEKSRLAMQSGPQLLELRARHKSGRTFWVETALKYYQSVNGGRLLSVIRDISVRKEHEEELSRYRDSLEKLVQERTTALVKAQHDLVQKERLALLGQLNATVSHEIRNPLGTIANALSLIEDLVERGDPGRLEKVLALANRSVERCTGIISELLDFSRPRDLEMALQPLDQWLQAEIAEYRLPGEVDLQDSCTSQVQVWFDGERLRRALVNVLDNAVHAMQEEAACGKTLGVSTCVEAGRVGIVVSDQGVGIAPADMPRIFEPLFSTKGFGVGLGMVIVKNILEQHGGAVEIESAPGVGTRVTLWLPIHVGGAAA